MTTVSGIGLSVCAAVALTTVSCMGLSHFRGGILEMPEWKPLSEDADFSNNYKNKYGSKYGQFLVGLNGNDEWWRWSANYRYRELLFEGGVAFAEVHSDWNKLKEMCGKAYKGTLSTEEGSKDMVIAEDSSKYNERDIWYACSGSKGRKPLTLGDVDSFEGGDKNDLIDDAKWKGKYGEKNKEKLLAIYHPNNEWVWDRRDKELNSQSSKAGFFFESGNGDDVKSRCSKAYGESSNPNETDLIRWCGLSESNNS